jgi:Flp pilus assembly secretin CpaC
MNRALRLLAACTLAASFLTIHAPAQEAAPSEPREGDLVLVSGRAQHIVPPWPVRGVSLTDPEVADVQLPLPELVVVSARAPGRTDILMWSEDGRTERRSLEVLVDMERLERDLSVLFPGAGLTARRTRS